jgi:hypothetical protein
MDEGLFSYNFATMEIKHISENKVCFQSNNILASLWI